MRKLILFSTLLGVTLMFSSCATIFTKSKQEITFTGEKGAKIYDKAKK